MPTFISDPPFVWYAILVLGVLVTGAVWFNRRSRKSLAWFGGFVLLLGLIFLLDRLMESPREESVRRVLEMAKAANARDTDGFLSHVAEHFDYQGQSAQPIVVSREQLRTAAMWGILKQYNVHVATWDFSRDDVVEVDANTVEIGFLGKGEVESKPVPMYFRARFTRQADGQMKLTSLASYDPMKRTNERKTIPYFP